MATGGSESLNKLKRKRKLVRSNVTKLINSMEDAELEKYTLLAKLNSLKEMAQTAETLDNQILDEMLEDASDAVLITETEHAMEVKENIVRAIYAAEKRTLEPTANSSNGNSAVSLKLPRLVLEKFELSASNWLDWWAQFKRIDEVEDLDEQTKFSYLKMTLVGSAKALVDSYPSMSDNYTKVLNHLKDRFGREELIVRSMYKGLLSLIREQPPLVELYDKISCKIRSLETIGVNSDRIAILVPLIEECLPLEVRKRWERQGVDLDDKMEKVDTLLEFLRKEAKCEERIREGERMTPTDTHEQPTAAALVNADKTKEVANKLTPWRSMKKTTRDERRISCLFCEAEHRSSTCNNTMSVDKRREIVRAARVCFACLGKGHSISRCRKRVDCTHCKGRHYALLCSKRQEEPEKTSATMLASQITGERVILKTLLVYARFKERQTLARVLIDSASHRSYVTDRLCATLKLEACGEEGLRHMLFGGLVSEKMNHTVHELELKSLLNDKRFKLRALQQRMICGAIPTLKNKKLVERVKERGVNLVDDEVERPIDILIGADHIGQLMTGTMKSIEPKLIAVETLLGWCLLGTTEAEEISPCLINVVSCLVCVPKLWDLETLGMDDLSNMPLKEKLNEDCVKHFERNVRFKDGSYEVALPWIENHPAIPTNRELARNRLDYTINRLKKNKLFDGYDTVFKQWEQLGFIEVVRTEDKEAGHYLPHRPVIKEEKTTKVRPVFDASAKRAGYVSLNECLATGPNLIAEILTLLLQFRREPFAMTADIKQAFLMIKLKLDSDKNMLKFLWKREGELIVYRHCRVVFGLTPSPFLLNAVIRHHLEQIEDPLIPKLIRSFYVDDCVLSVETAELGERYREVACEMLKRANFELRGWVCSGDEVKEHSVLGIRWYPAKDEIGCSKPKVVNPTEWTKRLLLSVLGRFYDPLGLIAAPLLRLKSLLQECFKLKLDWNDPIPPHIEHKLVTWLADLDLIEVISVKRNLKKYKARDLQLHVFCDACKVGLGVCIFLRSEHTQGIQLSFVISKARASPLEPLTIPRLELIAAGLAARLGSNISKILEIDNVTYWSDSMVVLYWISKGEWRTFVGNRVKEIRGLTQSKQWRFIEGTLNPADLLSRGCSLRELKENNWLAGPDWLKSSPNEWPRTEVVASEDALLEQRVVTMVNHESNFGGDTSLFSYFRSFKRNVRLMGWIRRFFLKTRRCFKEQGSLTVEELDCAEERLLAWIQKTWKPDDKGLETHLDNEGFLRVRTKITSEQFAPTFRSPLILTACPLVESLIEECHQRLYHAGVGSVLCHLRERVWIVKGRQLVRKVLKRCAICARHRGKGIIRPPIGLPDNRVNLGKVFQVTGCDLAGPLYLRNGNKVWLVLFTCAVYRAVHLEIVESLSTEDFLLALRRMIARRGRVTTMYSDNGTNFVGAWNSINRDAVTSLRIKWIFNIPTASWWGGFFERLIGILKMMLKTTLGRARLTMTELHTMVTEIEAVMNSRPISYVHDDSNEPLPISPSMFLQQEETETDTPDLDQADAKNVSKRVRYVASLRQTLKERFRHEYLGALILRSNRFKGPLESKLAIGSVVIIMAENAKRVDWNLGRVLDLIPGKDGFSRVAKLKTVKGEIMRPVQRLILLEGIDKELEERPSNKASRKISERDEHTQAKDNEISENSVEKRTSSGRLVKCPQRYLN